MRVANVVLPTPASPVIAVTALSATMPATTNLIPFELNECTLGISGMRILEVGGSPSSAPGHKLWV